jgi:tetratricopeptide (TPR) repeat protein
VTRRPTLGSAVALALGAALVVAPALDAAADRKRAPTIRDLKNRQVEIRVDEPVEAGEDRARRSYQEFLDLGRGDALLRAEAMRRLGDLKLEAGERERIETDLAQGSPLDTSDAIKLYAALLDAHPTFERNDSVLYQLARAYEADQQIERSLATLDALVARHPGSRYLDEAQFRRGEMLFSAQRWADAEAAYAAVMAIGPRSEFYEQSLYKHGWALFKRGDVEAALGSFARLLDRKLADPARPDGVVDLEALTRPQRELIEDTLRVSAISFSAEEEARGVDAFLARAGDKPYAWMLYGTLGDLYVDQERWTDAANAYRAFAKRDPNHEQSPVLQMQAVDAYRRGGFASLVLDGKREFVERYRLGSPFWASRDPKSLPLVVSQLKSNVKDLAAFHHSEAQRTKQAGDYQEAARWYREFLQSFPDDAEAPATNYLLADSLFESRQFRAAAAEYERTAYAYAPHDRSGVAAYAALVAYDKEEGQLPAGDAKVDLQRQRLASGLRFATTYESHPESAAVLVRTAREYFDLKDYAQAIATADLVLAKQPPVDAEKQRTAWTVLANGRFELGEFDRAEGAYLQVQSLLPAADPQRAAIDERLAASVYRQAEAKKAAGDSAGAVSDFLRVAQLAPTARVRSTADYDAAALLLQMQDWPRAIDVLESFRRNFPKSELQADVTRKLAVAYVEAGRPGPAAVEFERIANTAAEPVEVQREALSQAAVLYEESGDVARTVAMWEAYVKRFPEPFEPAIEARQKLADLALAGGDAKRRSALLRDVVEADRRAGAARTDRSRFLAAKAALELAAPARDAFVAIRLTAPLKRSLDAKRRAMEAALEGYEAADGYGIAEVSTAATFEMAELYRRLGGDLMQSERPKSLSGDALEQYDLLLEEQAFPFEEKAIEIHLVNVARAPDGVYDAAVRRSYAALAELKPARFAKLEEHEALVAEPTATRAVAAATPAEPAMTPVAATAPGEAAAGAPQAAASSAPVGATTPVTATVAVPPALVARFADAVASAEGGNAAAAEAAFAGIAAEHAAFAGASVNLGVLLSRAGRWTEAEAALAEAVRRNPDSAAAHAQLGRVYRELGRFADAERAYRRALELDPQSGRTHRNLGVLLDLYLQRPGAALEHYETALALRGGEDKQMSAWIAELRQRLGSNARTAQSAAAEEGA